MIHMTLKQARRWLNARGRVAVANSGVHKKLNGLPLQPGGGDMGKPGTVLKQNGTNQSPVRDGTGGTDGSPPRPRHAAQKIVIPSSL